MIIPSCQNITAPINITNNTKICQAMCNYMPLYKHTNIICKNMNTYILIQFDNSEELPICKFNNDKYEIIQVRIFNKSIHSYLNNYSEGEILIIHKNITKDNELLIVSVPIIKSSIITPGTIMINGIINSTYAYAPLNSLSEFNSTGSDKVSEQFVPNIKFDIKNLIPVSPYYFYKGIFSFQSGALGSCDVLSNIIVYSPSQGYISITDEIYSIFKTLLNNPSVVEYPISKNDILYYNSRGIINEDEDIYIDCQPVNKSTDTLYIPLKDELKDKSNDFEELVKELEKWSKQPLAGGIVGIILMLGLYYIIDNFLKILKK